MLQFIEQYSNDEVLNSEVFISVPHVIASHSRTHLPSVYKSQDKTETVITTLYIPFIIDVCTLA